MAFDVSRDLGELAESLTVSNGTVQAVNPPAAGDNSPSLSTTSWSWQNPLNHGQCRLSVQDSTHLVLRPFNGNKIIVGGKIYTIPSAGLVMSNVGWTSSQLGYIYVHDDGSGNLALDWNTTGHATDSSTGVEIRSGMASWTLVGLAYTNTSTQFVDNTVQRFLLSYFNRYPKFLGVNVSAVAGVSGWVEITTALRMEFLSWADSVIDFYYGGFGTGNGAGTTLGMQAALDGSAAGSQQQYTTYASGASVSLASRMLAGGNEAHHYATLLGYQNGGTGTYTQMYGNGIIIG